MQRLVIMTVGKTHSGKTSFAKALEQQLHNSLVIDQDNHAEFINTYYRPLLPEQGPNEIKYAITQTIVEYAINEANYHLILCNSNLHRKSRTNLLAQFFQKDFIRILVNFDIADHVLQERVAKSQRRTTIFRSASTFAEVLNRQQAQSKVGKVTAPTQEEADHLFHINDCSEVQPIIHKIIKISHNM